MEQLANFALSEDLDNDKHPENPSIYVACLAAYNAGLYHGAWIDATQDIEEIQEAIQKILAESPIRGSEEWEIHDHHFGYDFKPSKDLETLHEQAVFIAEHGELGVKLLDDCSDVEEAQDALEHHYHGDYLTQIEFAYKIFNETYPNIPDPVKAYINYQDYSSDIFISDYYSIELGNQVHVFSYS